MAVFVTAKDCPREGNAATLAAMNNHFHGRIAGIGAVRGEYNDEKF